MVPLPSAADETVDSGWNAPALLTDLDGLGAAGGVQLAEEGGGNVLAVWEVLNQWGSSTIWVDRYETGTGWTGATALAQTNMGWPLRLWDSGSSHYQTSAQPQLANDGSGRATLVWVDESLGPDWPHFRVMESDLTPSKGWATPISMDENWSDEWSRDPQNGPPLAMVAVSPNGTAMVLWTYKGRAWFKIRELGQGWSETEGVPGVSPMNDFWNPPYPKLSRLTFEPNGSALFFWSNGTQWRGFSNWSSRYVPGIGWQSPTLVPAGPGPAASDDPCETGSVSFVRADGSGTVLEVGPGEANATGSVWSSSIRDGAPVEGPRSLVSYVKSAPFCPAIVPATGGSAIAVWTQRGPADGGVWSSELSTTGQWSRPVVLARHDGGVPFRLPSASDGTPTDFTWWFEGTPEYVRTSWGWMWSEVFTNPRTTFTVRSGSMDPLVDPKTNFSMAMGLAWGGAAYAYSSQGDAVVVWLGDDRSTLGNVWRLASTFSPDEGWSTPVLIDTQEYVQETWETFVAMDANGNAMAVWVEAGSLQASYYAKGEGWGSPMVLSAWPGPSVNYPTDVKLAFDTHGNALAVWPSNGSLASSRFVPQSGWSTPVQVPMGLAHGETLRTYDVGFAPSGDATAVWSKWIQSNQTYSEWTMANHFTPASGWGGPEEVAPRSSWFYDVAMDAAGSTTVVWTPDWPSGNDSNTSIWFARRDAAGGWIAAGPLAENLGETDHSPILALNDEGEGLVAWRHYDVNGTEIWAARVLLSGGAEPPVLLGRSDGDAYIASVFVDYHGDGTVVWDEYGGGSLRTWSSKYIAPIQAEIQPTPTGGSYGAPIFAGVVMTTALAAGIVTSTSSRGAEALGAFIFAPLFTRLRRNDVRNQVNRGRILQFIEDHPGANFSEIQWRLGLSKGGCAYHMQVLERAGEVRRVANGVSVRFYPLNYRFDAEALPPLAYMQRRILEVIVDVGSATFGEISQELGKRGITIARKNLSYHLRVLVRTKELVSARREGGRAIYYVEPEERDYLQERLGRETRVDELLRDAASLETDARGDIIADLPEDGAGRRDSSDGKGTSS